MFGPFTSLMVTMTGCDRAVYGLRWTQRSTNQEAVREGPGPMRAQYSQAIIDQVICQQFLILFDGLILTNTRGYLYLPCLL